MRPKSIVQFERLLFAGLAIDLVNNLVAWPSVAASLTGRGMAANPALILLLCLLSPLVGLAFWYLIARRGSVIAKWVMTIFVACATIGFILTSIRGVAAPSLAMFGAAVVGELLKIAAVSRLFTIEAAAWLGKK